MDAIAPSEPAAKRVDLALADLDKALKGLEWSAEFSRLSGDPAAESLTALWQVLAGMGALMQARQAERAEIAAAVEGETQVVVDRASAELERRSAALIERLGPDLARAAERHAAARLWSIRLRTLLGAGAVAITLGVAVFAVSYGAGFSNGQAKGLVAGKTIGTAMAAGPAAARAWAQLMAVNDPVAAMNNCKAERDSSGRRYCQMPMWLEPPKLPGVRR
ncbi:MAG TPA: hypothetical protein VG798_02520 [Rhizomicrobium sp.]|jgi:hypothetical protein|nr:hypothetical protein [Rhizomicrobium sp.]HWB97525.1 hypothetical protein [Bryobacteraceae bacterium]